jgi:hypothetical protein
MENFLSDTLKQLGWTEVQKDWEYRKNNWTVLRDTSSWWMVGTDSNPYVFDIHEPTEYEAKWTENLIEHLCKMEDERARFRKSLEHIQNLAKEFEISDFTKETLSECYHRWLVNGDKLHCPICNSTKPKG